MRCASPPTNERRVSTGYSPRSRPAACSGHLANVMYNDAEMVSGSPGRTGGRTIGGSSTL